MRNINKDYLVVVNTKTATVRASSNMKFHVTDVLTCNIFFQLEFNDPSSRIVGLYEPEEHASNCQLTLRVAKPNGAKKEVLPESFELLDNANNLYVANLGTDFIDSIGFCECELLVKATVTTKGGAQHDEIFTTEMFRYEVVKSIFSDLSDEAEDIPEWPSIVESLATKEDVEYAVKNADKYDYATREYVNQVLIGGIDLSSYATKQYVDDALADFFVGEDGTINLSNYATKDHTHDEYITNEYLVAKNYATKSDIPTRLPANGGNADTVGEYGIWVGTQEEYDALISITNNVLYFIKENE